MISSLNSAAGENSTAPLRPLRLVIADDERDTVQTLMALLTDEGHSVFGAYKGSEVLAQVRLHTPDALILDIDMPGGMSGYSVAREIRELFEPSPPLLIAISGKWVGQTDKMLAELAGFNHFLQKPCDPQFLLRLLEPLRRTPAPAESETDPERTAPPRRR